MAFVSIFVLFWSGLCYQYHVNVMPSKWNKLATKKKKNDWRYPICVVLVFDRPSRPTTMAQCYLLAMQTHTRTEIHTHTNMHMATCFGKSYLFAGAFRMSYVFFPFALSHSTCPFPLSLSLTHSLGNVDDDDVGSRVRWRQHCRVTQMTGRTFCFDIVLAMVGGKCANYE